LESIDRPPTEAEIAEIRRQMARIRREIRADANAAAEDVQAAFEWQSYVRQYPWLTTGAAAGLGFLAAYVLTPSRPKPRPGPAPRAAEPRADQAPTTDQAQAASSRQSFGSMVWGFLAPIAIRALQHHAIKFVEEKLGQASATGQQEEPSDGNPPVFNANRPTD